ncbi:MAG: hypothetical protein LBG60_08695 [Bifidobacteriaceae bacterium]|jgi:electron transfer flavoprotein beta subunit|nr:hypothetical protein [Bifidobacteriaceae bacterium]
MDVACVFKWSRNEPDAWVDPDGTVKWRGAKLIATDDDAAAVAVARRLAQATGGELAGVTIGEGDARWALARGAGRVVCLAEAAPSLDGAATAAALAAAVRGAGRFDVVVMGDGRDQAGVAGTLAALLGLPVVAGVQEAEADPDRPGRLTLRRRLGGAVETLAVPTPALVAVAASAAEESPPGVKQLLAARRLPIEAPAPTGALPAARIAVLRSRAPEARTARLFEGDPAASAAGLVAALRGDGVL